MVQAYMREYLAWPDKVFSRGGLGAGNIPAEQWLQLEDSYCLAAQLAEAAERLGGF